MKIAHLTSVHPPFDNRIYHLECLSLVRGADEIVLIVPTDEPADGGAVRIHPLPVPSGRRERMTRTVWQVFRAALQERADLYHFHDPELIPIGMLMKLFGNRVIYVVHENIPQNILNKHWIPLPMRRIAAAMGGLAEWCGGHLFDGVVCVTPTIAHRFPRKRTILLRNYPDLEIYRLPDASGYSRREPLVAYIGGITKNRGAFTMLEAIHRMPPNLDVRLELAGPLERDDLIDELSAADGWGRVQYRGVVPKEEVVQILGRARVGLSVLHPIPEYVDAYPVKLFEYMAAGIPVVASDFPVLREIVDGAGCGLLVDPTDARAIAEAVTWLLDNAREAEEMGRMGRMAALNCYNWHKEKEKLFALYGEIL
ncbi:MAG: glycosyltransferase family 4 protein [SAR324 cluster bacterium]|nr:glycosyltransferase family 4 protein [SAR324 cluster bacterium]